MGGRTFHLFLVFVLGIGMSGTGINGQCSAGQYLKVGFLRASYSVAESVGTKSITINRKDDFLDAFTLTVVATNGTAGPGIDYTFSNARVVFGYGDFNKQVRVTILDDDVQESSEYFYLEITASTEPSKMCYTNINTTITIIDDDHAPPNKIPTDLYTDVYNSTTVLVGWTAINDNNIQGYTVFYKPTAGTGPYKNESFYGKRPVCLDDGCPITGLQPGTEYCFKIAAFNTQGLSKDWDNETCLKESTKAPTTTQQVITPSTTIATVFSSPTEQGSTSPTPSISPPPSKAIVTPSVPSSPTATKYMIKLSTTVATEAIEFTYSLTKPGSTSISRPPSSTSSPTSTTTVTPSVSPTPTTTEQEVISSTTIATEETISTPPPTEPGGTKEPTEPTGTKPATEGTLKPPCSTERSEEPTGGQLSNKKSFNWLLYVVIPLAALIFIMACVMAFLIWRLHVNHRYYRLYKRQNRETELNNVYGYHNEGQSTENMG